MQKLLFRRRFVSSAFLLGLSGTPARALETFAPSFPYLHFPALNRYWIGGRKKKKTRGMIVSEQFYDNRQVGEKAFMWLQGFSIAWSSSGITWEIYSINVPTNGNASAGIFFFLMLQKQSSMRHKYKWNQLCQPWICLLQQPKEMHFKGIISLLESNRHRL